MTAPDKEKKVIVLGEEVIKDSKEFHALSQEYDPSIKYMFELATENPERELPIMIVEGQKSRPAPHERFNPFRNLVFTSQIIWNNQRRGIRYYDGCDTIFVDKQPKDKDLIEMYNRQTKRRNFLKGSFGCYGDEKMLLLYLNICSWNAESEFRTRTANAVFVPVNTDKKLSSTISKLDLIEEAMRLAKEATNTKMRIHAAYIGIPDIDYDSGNPMSDKEIRVIYREWASKNPEQFIKDYGNKSIEVKYYIEKALASKTITNKFNPNKATWGSSNTEICDISGLKSNAAISERLFEFSQSEEGEEFLIQLKALYN